MRGNVCVCGDSKGVVWGWVDSLEKNESQLTIIYSHILKFIILEKFWGSNFFKSAKFGTSLEIQTFSKHICHTINDKSGKHF